MDLNDSLLDLIDPDTNHMNVLFSDTPDHLPIYQNLHYIIGNDTIHRRQQIKYRLINEVSAGNLLSCAKPV